MQRSLLNRGGNVAETVAIH